MRSEINLMNRKHYKCANGTTKTEALRRICCHSAVRWKAFYYPYSSENQWFISTAAAVTASAAAAAPVRF